MKKKLMSDGQQFHQYQQSKLSHLLSNHLTKKIPWHMMLDIQVLDLGQAQKLWRSKTG